MGMGMMVAAGAIGGLGSHLINESSIMAKDEENVKADTRQRSLEEWRFRTADAYGIEREKRAEAAAIRADDRNWTNEQNRAPIKAKMATDAAIGAKKAGLDFETENRDAISANTKAGANAKESDAERAQKEAQTDYYKANSEYTRGAKSDAAAARAAGKGGAGGSDAPGFDPLAGFDGKKAQAVALEQAAKEAEAASASGKPMTAAQQGQRAQQLYRSYSDAFASENVSRERVRIFKTKAREATTQEEIETVRQEAAKRGFRPEEMAALDPRFAVKAKPLSPQAQTVSKAPPGSWTPNGSGIAMPLAAPAVPSVIGAGATIPNLDTTRYENSDAWRRMNPRQWAAIEAAKEGLKRRMAEAAERDLAGE